MKQKDFGQAAEKEFTKHANVLTRDILNALLDAYLFGADTFARELYTMPFDKVCDALHEFVDSGKEDEKEGDPQ